MSLTLLNKHGTGKQPNLRFWHEALHRKHQWYSFVLSVENDEDELCGQEDSLHLWLFGAGSVHNFYWGFHCRVQQHWQHHFTQTAATMKTSRSWQNFCYMFWLIECQQVHQKPWSCFVFTGAVSSAVIKLEDAETFVQCEIHQRGGSLAMECESISMLSFDQLEVYKLTKN